MIVEEEFLGKLRRAFNLNLYEVKLWTALLSRGVSTAGELSDMANVPRSRTYDVLESLERKGFVVIQADKPIKYIAISPNDVLDRVNKRIATEAAKRTEKLGELKESSVIKELHQLYEQGIEPMSPTDFSGTLKGRHNIYDHLAMLIKEADKTVDIVTSGEGFVRKVRSLRPVIEKARERGVSVRIAAPLDGSGKDLAKEMGNLVNVRNVMDLNARFCIIDGKQMVFMLLDDKDTHPTYDLAMWISSPYFSGALVNMFNQVWDRGEIVTQEPQVNYRGSESNSNKNQIGETNVDV